MSDSALEEAVDDRLSFRRFAGIPLEEQVPDHATVWRFRGALGQKGLSAKLFDEVSRQMEAKGLLVKQGTLVDATIYRLLLIHRPLRKAKSRSAIRTRASRKRTAKRISGTRDMSGWTKDQP